MPRKHREGGVNRRRGAGGKLLSPERKTDLVVIDRLRKLLPDAELRQIIERSAADSDPVAAKKWQGLLNDICVPWRRQETLTTLAWKRGIKASEMIDAIRRHRLDLAMLQASGHLPEVVESAVEDSKRHPIQCPKCEGEGQLARKSKDSAGEEVVEWQPCKLCKGAGTVMEPGDAQARRLVAEMLGLVGKGGGAGTVINVNQQNQTLSVGAEAGGLEELLARTKAHQLAAPQPQQATVLSVEKVEEGDADGPE